MHKTMTDLKCLELGIMPDHVFRQQDPFASMSENERRLTCRKYRKVKRKLKKKLGKTPSRIQVMLEIRQQVWVELINQ